MGFAAAAESRQSPPPGLPPPGTFHASPLCSSAGYVAGQQLAYWWAHRAIVHGAWPYGASLAAAEVAPLWPPAEVPERSLQQLLHSAGTPKKIDLRTSSAAGAAEPADRITPPADIFPERTEPKEKLDADPRSQRCQSGSLLPVVAPDMTLKWTHLWTLGTAAVKTAAGNKNSSIRIVSPEFELKHELLGPTVFRIILHIQKDIGDSHEGRGARVFRGGRRRGIVSVKCNGGPLDAVPLDVTLWVDRVDSGEEVTVAEPQTRRHNFEQQALYELQEGFVVQDASAKLSVGIQLSATQHAVESIAGSDAPAAAM